MIYNVWLLGEGEIMFLDQPIILSFIAVTIASGSDRIEENIYPC